MQNSTSFLGNGVFLGFLAGLCSRKRGTNGFSSSTKESLAELLLALQSSVASRCRVGRHWTWTESPGASLLSQLAKSLKKSSSGLNIAERQTIRLWSASS